MAASSGAATRIATSGLSAAIKISVRTNDTALASVALAANRTGAVSPAAARRAAVTVTAVEETTPLAAAAASSP